MSVKLNTFTEEYVLSKLIMIPPIYYLNCLDNGKKNNIFL